MLEASLGSLLGIRMETGMETPWVKVMETLSD